MQVILLTFANSRIAPLATLSEEYAELNRRLSGRVLQQHFLAWSVDQVNTADFGYYLTLFRDQLVMFSFSGHAGRDTLLLEDQHSRSAGVAHLLAQCPNLKVVLLNGCSTAGQVEALHAADVPLVIATSAPVNDTCATQFSTRLFQALEAGTTIAEAFEQAIAQVLLAKDLKVFRDLGVASKETDVTAPVWGIFPNPAKPGALDWRLPSQAAKTKLPKDYTVNELLQSTLYDGLAATSPEIQALQVEGKNIYDNADAVNAAILKNLPAPLSEHLRKLLVPSNPGRNDGLDIIGLPRLLQLAQTYQISMDFMVFVHLAQLWELMMFQNNLAKLQPGDLEPIQKFLTSGREERNQCDYFTLLYNLLQLIKIFGGTPYVPEFEQLRMSFHTDDKIREACFFLENIRRMSHNTVGVAMDDLCYRAEESLALIFSQIGFLGHYKLATVRNIDVLKYRSEKPQFRHLVVKWHGTMGLYEKEITPPSDMLMDNRSVVLIRNGATVQERFLNLTPFIIDENTFEAAPDTSLSRLFFLGWLEPGSVFYKYINDPEKEFMDIQSDDFYDKRSKSNKFAGAIAQLEIFMHQVLQTENSSAA